MSETLSKALEYYTLPLYFRDVNRVLAGEQL